MDATSRAPGGGGMSECIAPFLWGILAGNVMFWLAVMFAFRFHIGFRQSDKVDRKTSYITELKNRIQVMKGEK